MRNDFIFINVRAGVRDDVLRLRVGRKQPCALERTAFYGGALQRGGGGDDFKGRAGRVQPLHSAVIKGLARVVLDLVRLVGVK